MNPAVNLRDPVSPLRPVAALVAAPVLAGLRCDESRERPGRCNAPGVAVVTFAGQHAVLCRGCAWNRIKHRGARLLMTTDAALMT